MLLKQNIKNIIYQNRQINYSAYSINNDEYKLYFKTSSSHKLIPGDKVFLTYVWRNIFFKEEKEILPTLSFYEKYIFDDMFIIKNSEDLEKEIPDGTIVKFINNIFFNESNHRAGFYTKNGENYVEYKPTVYNYLPTVIKEEHIILFNSESTDSIGDLYYAVNGFTNRSFEISYNPFKSVYMELVKDNIVTIKGNLENKFDERNSKYEIQKNKEGKIVCYEIEPKGSNFFEVIKYFEKNESGDTSNEKEINKDNFFEQNLNLDFNSDFDILINLEYSTNIEIYELLQYCKFSLPLSNNIATELNDEDICKTYFNERKKEIIPGISDYEKQCFSPCIKNNNSLMRASKINFNLFFRERKNINDWNSDDASGWNQFTLQIEKDGTEKYTKKNPITKGDLLGYLGFNDDDVYYRKKKLEKTFLRLSFYNSKIPSKQMLLFYSTIFLDTGELYTKYINNISYKLEHTDVEITNTVMDNEDENLTCTFSVSDRFDKNKSSEGFYIYTFPDYLEPYLNNDILVYPDRTIYMKIEFNHAGYGKTIPFILPRNDNGNTIGFYETDGTDMPKNIINEDNSDLVTYFDYLYIPIKLKYDNTLNEYVYYFEHYNSTNSIIDINLYEPKIN